MRKLTEGETKEINGGEVICYWSKNKYNKALHIISNGKLAVAHTDYYLGVLYPLVKPYKYGKR